MNFYYMLQFVLGVRFLLGGGTHSCYVLGFGERVFVLGALYLFCREALLFRIGVCKGYLLVWTPGLRKQVEINIMF